MKKIFLCASLLLAGALLFIFSSATTKPIVDSHKSVASFWPGAKVRNNTDWIMRVEIDYAGANQPKFASVAPYTTHTFEGSTNLIQGVWARLDIFNPIYNGGSAIGERVMYGAGPSESGIYKLIGLGCGRNCNFTITQYIDHITDRKYLADTVYKATVTKD
jgi:hypothetical protein